MRFERSLTMRGRLLIIVALVASLALWLLPGLSTTRAGGGRVAPAAPVVSPRGPLSSDPSDLRAKAAQLGLLRVIATLNIPYQAEPQLGPSAVSRQRAAIQAATQRVLGSLAGQNYQVNATYRIYPFVGLTVDPKALAALLGSPDVLRVTESLPKYPSDLESNQIIGADLAKSAGYTGTGYAVAVLDSGVQTSHPFFAGRTVAEACFSRTVAADGTTSLCPNHQSTGVSGAPAQTGAGAGVNCTINQCEHGTHVAGIAVGKNYSGGPGYDGVAPAAKLIAIQIYSKFTKPSDCGSLPTPCISAYDEDLLAAMQYVQTTLAVSHTIAAVNMSLGDGTNNPTPCDASPYFTAVGGLRTINIATVIAAGNQGYSNGLSGPGCVSNAISVGSTTKSDDISSFSNRAGYMSLFAPGSGIESSVPGSGFDILSGTSMSAPHVAGAWAVMRQRYPSESVTQILARLRTTGKPIAIGPSTSIPRIQLNTALGLASATPTPTQSPTSTPNPDTSYMIQDGGFELGSPNPRWEEESTNFGTPICSTSCLGDGPRTGTHWAWFGGTLQAEQSSLQQQKKIAPGPKQLTFWLWWSSGNEITSTFKVKMDGAVIFALTGATNTAYRSRWTAVAIDISAYADGNVHTLRFEESNQASETFTNIYLDDVNFGNILGAPTPTQPPGFRVKLPVVLR